jgi:hypothetical protein
VYAKIKGARTGKNWNIKEYNNKKYGNMYGIIKKYLHGFVSSSKNECSVSLHEMMVFSFFVSHLGPVSLRSPPNVVAKG